MDTPTPPSPLHVPPEHVEMLVMERRRKKLRADLLEAKAALEKAKTGIAAAHNPIEDQEVVAARAAARDAETKVAEARAALSAAKIALRSITDRQKLSLSAVKDTYNLALSRYCSLRDELAAVNLELVVRPMLTDEQRMLAMHKVDGPAATE